MSTEFDRFKDIPSIVEDKIPDSMREKEFWDKMETLVRKVVAEEVSKRQVFVIQQPPVVAQPNPFMPQPVSAPTITWRTANETSDRITLNNSPGHFSFDGYPFEFSGLVSESGLAIVNSTDDLDFNNG